MVASDPGPRDLPQDVERDARTGHPDQPRMPEVVPSGVAAAKTVRSRERQEKEW